jgi:hypothetical protein
MAAVKNQEEILFSHEFLGVEPLDFELGRFLAHTDSRTGGDGGRTEEPPEENE